MGLKLRNTSLVRKVFGLTGGFGAFVNNKAIKNNPKLVAALASKEARAWSKKKMDFKSSHKIAKHRRYKGYKEKVTCLEQ